MFLQVGVIAVKEETFNILTFEKQQGARIGEYELAYKTHNLPDKWKHAYDILRQNNVTISNRYYGEGYVYSYWLYGEDKIYRQRLKQEATVKPHLQTQTQPLQIEQYFPSDLRCLLSFTEKDDLIIISPRQYLGAENFAKIATIVRELGGFYVPGGKSCHFEIRKVVKKNG